MKPVLLISNNKALPLCLLPDKHAGKCPPTQPSALLERQRVL